MPILPNEEINMKLFIFLYFLLKNIKNNLMFKLLIQCYPLLFDSIILFENKKIFSNLLLFLDVDWIKIDKIPVNF